MIDLRNNPGGLLDSAVDVAGKFVPPNTVIVSTKGRTPDQSQDFRARVQRQHPDYPIVVLINGYSASGAEIVAGALKDLNRAILVGETTFGKGSVQTVQPLGNGVGLRLTMAKYYTPSKKTIHEVGVSPDIEVPISDAEERRIMLAEAKRSADAGRTGRGGEGGGPAVGTGGGFAAEHPHLPGAAGGAEGHRQDDCAGGGLRAPERDEVRTLFEARMSC